MTKLPSVTGKELIAALAKVGFQVFAPKVATTSYVTKTAAPRSFRCMPVKLSAQDS